MSRAPRSPSPPSTQPPDKGEGEGTLLARARAGDRGAFGALVRTYQRRVYLTALHILGSHADADDVTQETFIRAYRALSGFDGRADLFTWLYRIAVNTALNQIRTRKRLSNLATAAESESDAGGAEGARPESPGARQPTPEEWLALDQEVRSVLEAIARLSETLRVTLVLATMAELSYKQIAEVLEIPEGTVAWRVNEARRQLKLLLAGDDITDFEP
jgi:RNA polymerase sigma-70 factor, ECF subfamily